MRATPFVTIAVTCAAAACTTIDLDALSRGESGAGATGATAGPTGGSPSSASSATGSTGATTVTGTTSTVASASDGSVVSSAATGCGPSYCTGVSATFCWDFDDGLVPAGFDSNDANAVGMLDVAPSPTDGCSQALRTALLGFDNPAEPAYLQHGREIDVSAVTQSLGLDFATFTVSPQVVSIGVVDFYVDVTQCQMVMLFQADQGQSFAHLFVQSRPENGDWTYDGGNVIPIASPVGRWVDWNMDFTLSNGVLQMALTVDGTTQTTPIAGACNAPTDGTIHLRLGPNYVSTPQTSFFDNLVVDIL